MVAGLPLTEFMNHVDRRLNMLDGGGRQDAMAQIEDMSVAGGGTAQYIFNAALNFMEGGIQSDRIEVALDGTVIAN
jgi:hypothetical protein